MKYSIIRTDKADEGIRHTILYLANQFGNEFALKKLDYIEETIKLLEDNPYIGTYPRYAVLKRQGYRVLILEKNIAFYKVDEEKKEVIIYAFVDQRQDYVNIIRGLWLKVDTKWLSKLGTSFWCKGLLKMYPYYTK